MRNEKLRQLSAPDRFLFIPATCGGEQHIFRATGSTIAKPGFMAVYLEGKDDYTDFAKGTDRADRLGRPKTSG